MTQCPPARIYDPNLFRVVPNPDFRLAAGDFCVLECPGEQCDWLVYTLEPDWSVCGGNCVVGLHAGVVTVHGMLTSCCRISSVNTVQQHSVLVSEFNTLHCSLFLVNVSLFHLLVLLCLYDHVFSHHVIEVMAPFDLLPPPPFFFFFSSCFSPLQ